MESKIDVLQKYWKHNAFRPLQSEIIDSVLDGNDTFALMPTGGGKSICFQVPALMKEGICLVISPLIALMKDQVANLQKRNIRAIALTGSIKSDDLIELLDNCEYGNYKFLYLSPERLKSNWVIDRIKGMNINLIAIDEAHCVSQWGHDFRPAYLEISELKKDFANVPFIALTATATPRVQLDVIEHLGMKEPHVFKQSFGRKNIACIIIETEDKFFKIEQILNRNPKPTIIYVRNRKSCIDISEKLNLLGIKSTYYHGGLTAKDKDKNMLLWLQEEARVIVATNAFGMGIDKENVMNVIHFGLPENLENYYQETGRAGRDGNKAYAVLLVNKSDFVQAEYMLSVSLVDKVLLKEVYIRLCNYFQIAYGEGINETYSLNLNAFCVKYNFPPLKAYNALQFLDRQGVIELSQEFSEKNSLMFIASSEEIMSYISLNNADSDVISALVRAYSGIHTIKTSINLKMIADKTNHTEIEVQNVLLRLKDKEIVDYTSKNNDTTLTFSEIREDELTINRIKKHLEAQNKLKEEQLKYVFEFVRDDTKCKNRMLVEYFGEKEAADCGICSYCISKKEKIIDLEAISVEILNMLKIEKLSSREIQLKTNHSSDAIIAALKLLLEREEIIIRPNNKYSLKK